MSLRQEIIEDRIDETAKVLGIVDKDRAFLRLAHSIITGQSIHAFDATDLVDGGQDKQIDIITIEEGDEEATVYIIQAKNTKSFSSNMLIQMRNGLHWIFDKPRADLQELSNSNFRDKILAYRSVQTLHGPSRIRIVVVFVTNGRTSTLSDEFKQESKTINDNYASNVFDSFILLIYGCDELLEQINAAEKKNKKIDVDIKIKYDRNAASMIQYTSEGLRGMVCRAPGREIARIVNADPSGFVFDSNIRRFLGDRGAVNKDIRDTCTSTESSHLFWFLNNGITIACDSFDPVRDPDNPQVKIKNMQIVNGCQTATTLAQAAQDKKLEADVFVLLRIYETTNNTLVDRIVLTTNNQNKISNRDLRANDHVQVEMQERFNKFGLYYERKGRQFDKVPGINASRIAANELVAQSYLGIVLKKPSDARSRKYKIWGDLYDKVFSSNSSIEPYVISFILHRLVVQWLRSSGKTTSANDITRRLASNGAFHVARIAAFCWRGGDDWSKKGDVFDQQIKTLENSPSKLDVFFDDGLKTLESIVTGNSHFANDIEGAMKSNILDSEIDKNLYKSKSPDIPTHSE